VFSRLTVNPVSLAFLFLGFVLATVTRADADLWGHLRYGLDSIRDRGLTTVDPYSFTQDKPWVNHEWLSELVMAAAYSVGSVPGLVTHKALLITIVFVIIWRGFRGASPAAIAGVFVGVVFGTIHMTSSIRPQLWTFVGIAILCRTLMGDRPRALWWLPLLFAIWVNSHGGWIVGLGVLGVWAAADVWSVPARWRRWAPLIAAVMLATLVNPYGWHLWLFLGETVRMTRNVTEWGPLWGTPVLNWIPWAVATAAIPWAIARRVPRRWQIALVLAMLAYASARVMRIESLFVTAAAILLAPTIRERWPAHPTALAPIVAARSAILALAIVVVVAGGWAATSFRSVRCVGIWGVGTPDVAAMPSLRHALDGRIVTFFDWGQYALWHVGPRLRVSMDGRRETVYSDARLAEHDDILLGREAGLRALAAWRAEYVWLPVTARTTADWLEANGYRIDVRTARSFVAVRNDLPVLPPVGDAEWPTGVCFPG
jgi:hypothetical protein